MLTDVSAVVILSACACASCTDSAMLAAAVRVPFSVYCKADVTYHTGRDSYQDVFEDVLHLAIVQYVGGFSLLFDCPPAFNIRCMLITTLPTLQ